MSVETLTEYSFSNKLGSATVFKIYTFKLLR